MHSFYAVTGDIGAGKTSFLLELAKLAQRSGIQVGGFVQTRADITGRLANAYDLVRVNSGETLRIAQRDSSKQFVFDDAAFQRALDWIREDVCTSKLIMVDEIGLIESEGKGHAKTLEFLLAHEQSRTIVLSLREKKASEWIRKLSMTSRQLLHLLSRNSNREVFAKQIIQSAQIL